MITEAAMMLIIYQEVDRHRCMHRMDQPGTIEYAIVMKYIHDIENDKKGDFWERLGAMQKSVTEACQKRKVI